MDIVITRPTSELLGSQRHDAIKKKKKKKKGLNAELPSQLRMDLVFTILCLL